MAIRRLPDYLINRIAAGEVVERPASVVKELVENSLDAGATTIDVVLEAGGKSRICVRDDGCGMNREDVLLAVERHATSKLSDDMLVAITTMGFRGEALPSIAAVSRVTITTAEASAANGWQLSIEGGQQQPIKAAPAITGTTIDVRDLFYAVPARLKFLRTDSTELQHISDTLNRLAMAYPQVALRMQHGGRSLLEYQARPQLIERLADVLGEEFAVNALAFHGERAGMAAHGYCAYPTYNKATAASLYLFVNNRPVRDKLLLGAAKAAYQEVLARDRYPYCVLFLQIPAQDIDVNVHPAKAEVRFRDGQAVRSLIIRSIRDALQQHGCNTATTVQDQALQAFQPFTLPADSVRAGATANNGGYQSSYRAEVRQTGAIHSNLQQAPRLFDAPAPQMRSAAALATLPVADNAPSQYPLGAAVAQVHQTYIVAQNADGLVLVDQHAAHERLLYEQMLAARVGKPVASQLLLVPEVITLSSAEQEALLHHGETLATFGLVVESFGYDAVVVRSMPALLKSGDIAAIIRDLAAQLSHDDTPTALAEKFHEVCGNLACKAAVKAGQHLSIAEMNTLLRQMENTPNASQCNHGRPTVVKLSRVELEKLFGRR